MATIQTKIDRFALLEWLISVKQEEVWEKIAQVQKQVEQKQTFTPFSFEEYQAELSLGKQQIAEGKFVSQENLEKESQKWL